MSTLKVIALQHPSGAIDALNTATTGNVGIGSATPAARLHVNGTSLFNGITQISSLGIGTPASGTTGEIRATNNITAYYSSDASLKENVVTISDAMLKLNSIRGVEFDWTSKFIMDHGGEDGYFVRKHDVGIIAQEVQKVLPEAVAVREDNILAVKYEKIIPLLIEAIKEQQVEINMLKKRIGD